MEVLYQRYFLRMNQNNMTSLLTLLIGKYNDEKMRNRDKKMMMMMMRNRDKMTSMNALPAAIAMTMIVVNYIVSDADSIMQVKKISFRILNP